MSYRIAYATPCKQEVLYTKKNIKKNKFIFVAVLALLLFVFSVSGVRKRASELFIPGDPEVTSKAFSKMIGELRNGIEPQEAITAFCQQILDGANNEIG